MDQREPPADGKRVVLSWSGGKDSALALHHLREEGRTEIVSLLTTIAGEYGRISHHGVRAELLEQQARAVGVLLHPVVLPTGTCTNAEYEVVMERVMLEYRDDGVETVAFGDIFLEDLRRYRENNLAKVSMGAVFPLWRRDTDDLVREFIDLGFKAILACVDGRKLAREFAGRSIDKELLSDLPSDVDPCGENGEFHSFVWDGPIFERPVPVQVGEVVSRDVRFFADLIPVNDLEPDSATP